MRQYILFLSSGITGLVLGITPIGFFPRTPSFTNVSFVDSPDPLTGHSVLLHILHVFVAKRGLTCIRKSHYLRPTILTVSLQVSVALCAVV